MLKTVHWTVTQRKERSLYFSLSFVHWHFSTDLGVVCTAPKLLLSLSISNVFLRLLLSPSSQVGDRQEGACPASLPAVLERLQRKPGGAGDGGLQVSAPLLAARMYRVSSALKSCTVEFPGKYSGWSLPLSPRCLLSWEMLGRIKSVRLSLLRYPGSSCLLWWCLTASVSQLWRKASSLIY